MAYPYTRYEATDGTPNPIWLIAVLFHVSALMAADNGLGSDAFGQVLSGRTMGRITSSKLVRPATLGLITVTVSGVIITTAGAPNFAIGDLVSVYDAAGVLVVGSDGRAVTAVSATTITVDGASISLVIGQSVKGDDGSGEPVGILLESRQTATALAPDGTCGDDDQPSKLLTEGTVLESALRDFDLAQRAAILASPSLSIVFEQD